MQSGQHVHYCRTLRPAQQQLQTRRDALHQRNEELHKERHLYLQHQEEEGSKRGICHVSTTSNLQRQPFMTSFAALKTDYRALVIMY